MAGIGRILAIVAGVAVVGGGGGYFALPSTAAKTQSFQVAHSQQSVLTHFASTPANTVVAEGITVTHVGAPNGNNVVADLRYADGVGGRVTYTVTPDGEGSKVEAKLERNLGLNPMDKINGMNNAPVEPVAAVFFPALNADLSNPSLEGKSYEGLSYEVVQVAARPFLFNANCSPTDPKEIREAVAQSLAVLQPVMHRYNLTADGPPIAVETEWDTPEHRGQYCFQIGYAFTGTAPRLYAGGQVGQTPAGTAMRVHYSGAEENVLPTYDKMELAIWAAHLTQGRSFEVYYDNAEQSGGAVNRDIYYLITGDTASLTTHVPSAGPVPAPGAPAAPAAATDTTAPAATTTTATTTATTTTAP